MDRMETFRTDDLADAADAADAVTTGSSHSSATNDQVAGTTRRSETTIPSTYGGKKHRPHLKRGLAACMGCRDIKMKCVGGDPKFGTACRRCSERSRECVYRWNRRGRKPQAKEDEPALDATRSGVPSSIDAFTTNPLGDLPISLSYQAGYLEGSSSGSSRSRQRTREPRLFTEDDDDSSSLHRDRPRLNVNDGSRLDPGRCSDSDAPEGLPAGILRNTRPKHSSNPLGLVLEAIDQIEPVESLDRNHGASSSNEVERRVSGRRQDRYGPSHGYDDQMDSSVPGHHTASMNPRDSAEDAQAASFTVPSVLYGLVSYPEIESHVQRYYRMFHESAPLLCPALHTARRLSRESVLLLTVIVTLASRLQINHDMFDRLSLITNSLVRETLSSGHKSISAVQALLLLTLWPLDSTGRQEHSRTWYMLGLTLRMATDLNLFATPFSGHAEVQDTELDHLERVDRERCWLFCFALDRSISIQLGKPWTLPETELIRRCYGQAWHSRPYNQPTDVGLVCYVQIQRCLSKTVQHLLWTDTAGSITGLVSTVNIQLLLDSMEVEIASICQLLRDAASNQPSIETELRGTASFFQAYTTLLAYSLALEFAVKNGEMTASLVMLPKIYATSMNAVEETIRRLDGTSRQTNEGQILQISYATLSIVKMLELDLPAFTCHFYDILGKCLKVAELLYAKGLDASHGPRLFGGLLRKAIVNRLICSQATGEMPLAPSRQDDLTGTRRKDLALPVPAGPTTRSMTTVVDSLCVSAVTPAPDRIVDNGLWTDFATFLEAQLDLPEWGNNDLLTRMFHDGEFNFFGNVPQL